MAGEKTRDGALAEDQALLRQPAAQRFNGDVAFVLEDREDCLALRFDPPGAAITAERLGARVVLLTLAALTPNRSPAWR